MSSKSTEITEVKITPIKPNDGLVAFASCIIDNKLFIGSLGIHKKLNGSGYRITYPTKKVGTSLLNYYHPITREAGLAIEKAVTERCAELLEKSDENYDRHNKATHPDA